MQTHSITRRRSTGNWEAGIIPGSTGNRVKSIPGNQVTAFYGVIPGHYIIPGHCIIPGRCLFWFHAMRLVGIGIMDPMQTALM